MVKNISFIVCLSFLLLSCTRNLTSSERGYAEIISLHEDQSPFYLSQKLDSILAMCYDVTSMDSITMLKLFNRHLTIQPVVDPDLSSELLAIHRNTIGFMNHLMELEDLFQVLSNTTIVLLIQVRLWLPSLLKILVTMFL